VAPTPAATTAELGAICVDILFLWLSYFEVVVGRLEHENESLTFEKKKSREESLAKSKEVLGVVR